MLPTIGSPLNRPPRIAEEAMPVSRFITAHVNTSCPTTQLTFQAIVDEPDLSDDTHWRIYVDWDPTTNPVTPYADVVSGQGVTQPLRSVPAGQGLSLPLNSTSPLGTVGTHTVELWITDGPADNVLNRRPAAHPPGPDGGMLDQWYVATYAWVVTVRGDCL